MLALLSFYLGFANAVLQLPFSQSSASSPDFGHKELWKLQNDFWTRFLYPANVREALSINSTLFSANVQGRVSDSRTFDGSELNTEYIFGLFTPSSTFSFFGLPMAYEIIHFTANQNIASSTTRVNFTITSFGNITVPVIIDTWMTWDAHRRINQYDATFRWWSFLFDELLKIASNERAGQPVLNLVESICDAHTRYCTGPNIQYHSRGACISFLLNRVRVGRSWEFGMNTVMCRSMHQVMLQFRPDVHCSHIGKVGGGMCEDDQTYLEKASKGYFSNSPWIPEDIR